MPSQTLPSLPDLTSTPVTPRSLVAAVSHGRMGHALQVWRERARGRGELRRLLGIQHALGGPMLWQDLGRSRADLLAEARKPFWRA